MSDMHIVTYYQGHRRNQIVTEIFHTIEPAVRLAYEKAGTRHLIHLLINHPTSDSLTFEELVSKYGEPDNDDESEVK